MQQAARVSDFTAFMYMGDMVEFDATDNIFTNLRKSRPKIISLGVTVNGLFSCFQRRRIMFNGILLDSKDAE